MNLTVMLFRHGRTAWNHQRRFLGSTDIGLDEVGWSQARGLADRTGASLAAVYSSPLARARETASCLADNVVELANLRELAQGDLEGLKFGEALERYATFFQRWREDPTDVGPPGGETLGSCRDRGLAALAAIVDRHGDGDVVGAVSHQLVIGSVTCTMAGAPLSEWSRFGVGNCDGVLLKWDGVNWQIAGQLLIGSDLIIAPGSIAPDV